MRDLKIKVETATGTINWFLVLVGNKKVIDADASVARTITIIAKGFGSAKYKVSLDLEGTINDRELTIQLTNGNHTLKLVA
jgi:Flp pilus assembly secretin CpaC